MPSAINWQGAACSLATACAMLRDGDAEVRTLARTHVRCRGRRKIAIVAVARHLLRLGYYLLRDGTTYDPQRGHGEDQATSPAA